MLLLLYEKIKKIKKKIQVNNFFILNTLRLSSDETLFDRLRNMSITLETGPREGGAVADDSVIERERAFPSPGLNS